MISIQEIFLWYRDLPKIPSNLTSIQQEEWRINHSSFLNKSFVGEQIVSCPAKIEDIQHEKIIAYADYNIDYSIDSEGKHYGLEKNTAKSNYFLITYEILYEESKFYDLLKSIHTTEMVEISGVIKEVSWSINDFEFEKMFFYGGSNKPYTPKMFMSVQLSLISIKRREKIFLHAELLDHNLRYISTGCFIATACYGNYNAPEVMVLRQFRDDKLIKTFLGKLLVHFYYSFSPFLAKLISKSDLIKIMFRKYFLELIIAIIQRQNKF